MADRPGPDLFLSGGRRTVRRCGKPVPGGGRAPVRHRHPGGGGHDLAPHGPSSAGGYPRAGGDRLGGAFFPDAVPHRRAHRLRALPQPLRTGECGLSSGRRGGHHRPERAGDLGGRPGGRAPGQPGSGGECCRGVRLPRAGGAGAPGIPQQAGSEGARAHRHHFRI